MVELVIKFFLSKECLHSRILWAYKIRVSRKVYSVTRQSYLFDWASCLQFKFGECFKEQDAADFDFPEDLEGFEDDEYDKDINQNQQIFDFVDVP